MAKGSKMKTEPIKRTAKKDTVTTSRGTGRQSTLSPAMKKLAEQREREKKKREAYDAFFKKM